ncbi:MAG: GNAT family N-acetyltransferase, partial [Gammaproteobacteria bacterium]|nr:GNAT family N-acetyltransferase [Gammaproteobacteria bacterium]
RKLSSLFSLLIYAHYRTQPSDLRHLLDDEHVHLYTLELADNILAVALISREGGFDAQLSTEIYRGLRRPQGNLLPQTLTFHAGCEQAATLNYARIMRIAVHPELQQQGLGTYLLKNIVEKEKQHVDVIGTSFGATVELLSFWKKAGFEMVRMGFTRDHASGAHSAVMMMPFSERGCQVFSQIRKKFQYHLSYWLAEPLRYLSSDIRRLLERQVVEDMPELSNEDWKDIYSFIDTHRGYEACMGPINKLLKKYSLISKMDNDQNRLILETKVLQQKSWSETVKICGITGKANAIQKLRQAVFAIIEQYHLTEK